MTSISMSVLNISANTANLNGEASLGFGQSESKVLLDNVEQCGVALLSSPIRKKENAIMDKTRECTTIHCHQSPKVCTKPGL